MRKTVLLLVLGPLTLGVLILAALWSTWPSPANGTESLDTGVTPREMPEDAGTTRRGDGGDLESAGLRHRLDADNPLGATAETDEWEPEGSGGLLVGVVDGNASAVPMVGFGVVPIDGRDPVAQRRDSATDRNGVARVEGLPVGPVRVWLADRSQSAVVTIRPEATTEHRFVLRGGSHVLGRVIDGTGAAVPRATVIVGWNSSSMKGMAVGVAGQDGRFELRNLADRGYVGASAPGYAPSPLFPLRAGPAAAKGGPCTLTIVLAEAGARVRGVVLGADRDPVAGAVVQIGGRSGGIAIRGDDGQSRLGWVPVRVLSTRDGSFAADGLPPGEVEFLVHANGHAPYTQYFDLGTGMTTTVTLHLVKGASMRGRVLDPAGRPVAGAHVSVKAFGYVLMVRTRTSADGRFDLRGLDARRIRLAVDAEGFVPYRAEHAAQPGERLQLEVRLRAARTFRGRLLGPDAQPLRGWLVMIRHRAGLFVTDDKGRFAGGVGDRATVELAISAPTPRRFSDCTFLGVVPVGDEETTIRVPVELLPTARVRGRLVDERSDPVTAAGVYLRPAQGGARYLTLPVDRKTGSFDLGSVLPGRYVLHWTAEKGDTSVFGALAVEVVPGQVCEVGDVFAFSRRAQEGGWLRVAIRRRDGAVVENPSVFLFDATDREIGSLPIDPETGARKCLPPGAYTISVMSNNAEWRRRSFAIRSRRTTTQTFELAASTRRYILFPWPVPAGLKGRSLRFSIEDENGATVAADELSPTDVPYMYMPGFRVGRYRLQLATEGGPRYTGQFVVDSLRKSRRPIVIAVERQ